MTGPAQLFGLRTDARKFFFDRTIVFTTLHDAHVEYLGRIGGTVAKTARNSMKKGRVAQKDNKKRGVKKGDRLHAGPGRPPRYWSGDLRKGVHGVQYHAHPGGKPLVLIGPVPRRGSKVPEVLEFGGSTVTTRWDPVRKRIYKVRVRIGKHAYMKPAYDKHVSKFPKWWAEAWGRFARKRRRGAA